MNLSHLPLLAIDGGTNCGYALWCPERKLVFHGSWNLGKDPQYGKRYLAFFRHLTDLLKEHGFEYDLRVLVIIEAPAYGTMKGAQAELGPGWVSIVKFWAETRKLAEPKIITSNSWRSYFIDGKKKPKAFKGPEATKWFKEQVELKCNALGITPKDNDAADAVGIVKWAKDGRIADLESRRAAVKREKSNKRAQGKLDLVGEK